MFALSAARGPRGRRRAGARGERGRGGGAPPRRVRASRPTRASASARSTPSRAAARALSGRPRRLPRRDRCGALPAALAAGLRLGRRRRRARAGACRQGSGRDRADSGGDRSVRRRASAAARAAARPGSRSSSCGPPSAGAMEASAQARAAGAGRPRRRPADGGCRRPAGQRESSRRRPRALRPRPPRERLLGRLVRDVRGRRAVRRRAARPTRSARETLAEVIAAVRPGAVAGDLDALARPRPRFPHHTGHGLGTAYHEEPRLVPGSIDRPRGRHGGRDRARHLRRPSVCASSRSSSSRDDGCEILSGHDLEPLSCHAVANPRCGDRALLHRFGQAGR